MSFKIDKQTLDDLAIFGNNRTKSVYDIFNRTRTRGGAKILEEMFLYPLSDADQINERSDVIRYYRDIEAEFPQRLDVAIDRLALRRDAVSLEAFENLRHGQAGDSVGLLHEHLRNVEELEFLQIGRHGTPSLLCLSYHTDYTSLFPQVN